MFTRILVPTDFSAPSDAALEYARTLARTFGAGLHVLHLLENEFLRPVVADPQALNTAALRRLQERLTDDDRRTLHAIPVIERSDTPADEVASYARTHDIDLIVMGTQGRTGMAHLLVGSVAEKVIRTAPCPVLTLREAPSRRTNTNPTRILVPTDFSSASDAALGCARRLAARFMTPTRVSRGSFIVGEYEGSTSSRRVVRGVYAVGTRRGQARGSGALAADAANTH